MKNMMISTLSLISALVAVVTSGCETSNVGNYNANRVVDVTDQYGAITQAKPRETNPNLTQEGVAGVNVTNGVTGMSNGSTGSQAINPGITVLHEETLPSGISGSTPGMSNIIGFPNTSELSDTSGALGSTSGALGGNAGALEGTFVSPNGEIILSDNSIGNLNTAPLVGESINLNDSALLNDAALLNGAASGNSAAGGNSSSSVIGGIPDSVADLGGINPNSRGNAASQGGLTASSATSSDQGNLLEGNLLAANTTSSSSSALPGNWLDLETAQAQEEMRNRSAARSSNGVASNTATSNAAASNATTSNAGANARAVTAPAPSTTNRSAGGAATSSANTAATIYHNKVTPTEGADSYKVVAGDTLYSIAFRYGLDYHKLASINNIVPPYSLSVGQVLVLKLKEQEAPSYEVQKGDTLYSIARKNGQSVSFLAGVNNLEPPYSLSVGQKIWLSRANSDDAKGNASKNDSVPVAGATGTSSSTTAANNKGTTASTAGKGTTGTTAATKPNTGSTTAATKPSTSTSQNAQTPIINSKTKKVAGVTWSWPTSGRLVEQFSTAELGNKGIDIAGQRGQAILSAADGQVVYAGNALRGFGNLVIINHTNEYLSAYAHNDVLLVKEGQKVRRGQQIARMGSTDTTSPRLHFEIRYRGQSVNPVSYLPK